MIVITKEIEIDMGHAITNHEGKCVHIHGHRFKIIASVTGDIIEEGSSQGTVIDFGDLKAAMMKVLDAPYDHGFMLWEKDPRADLLRQAHELRHNDANKFHLVPFVPTVENLSKYWFEALAAELNKSNIKLTQIEVFETPSSSAIYTED